jgi:hypothetical protein
MGVGVATKADIQDTNYLVSDDEDRPASRKRVSRAPGLVVGRMGALAVALGIGTAVVALPGLAAADTGSDGASGSATSSESSSSPRGAAHSRGRSAVQPSPASPGKGLGGAAAARKQTRGTSDPTPSANTRAANPASASAAASTPTLPSNSTSSNPAPSASAPLASTGNRGATARLANAYRFATADMPAASPPSAVRNPIDSAVLYNMEAQAQATVRAFFHGLSNWVSTLPVNPITNWLDGALLTVRRTLFNQTASVNAIQTVNTSQLITGKIDVTDPDGEEWKIEVVGSPSHGTVVLGTASQANGIGGVKYSYTPDSDFTGDDQFVVAVTATGSTFNIADPFGLLNTRYYTVAVGDAAEANKACFSCGGSLPEDAPDTHLFLANAGVTVTVKKQGFLIPNYTASITLPETTGTRSFDWMDARGNKGTISVDQMLTEDWEAYEKKAGGNGVKPLLVFDYSDQGTEKAVFVNVSSAAKNTDGSYTLTGQLMSNAPAQDGRVDQWDFIGHRYKTAYENFLAAADLDSCTTGHACTTVSAVGTLGTTTFSPSAFSATGGRDYGVPTPGGASGSQTSPGSIGPGQVSVGQGNGTDVFGSTGNVNVELAAMIPWGNNGSFITASNLTQGSSEGSLNGIYLYTANGNGPNTTWTPTQLQSDGWNAVPNVLAEYDQPVTDSSGNVIPTKYAGTVIPSSATYSLPATISNMDWTPPATFEGTFSGNNMLTVTSVISGSIDFSGNDNGNCANQCNIVGGPVENLSIQAQLSGTPGGVGTYRVSEFPTGGPQAPAPGQTFTMSAGEVGNGLQIPYSALMAAGITDYSSLVGAQVTGPGVAAGTTIMSYGPGFGGTTSDTYAKYQVNTSNLVGGAEPLTIVVNQASNNLTVFVPHDVNPASLVGQEIQLTGTDGGNTWITNTTITGFVTADTAHGGDVTYTVSNPILSTTADVTFILPNTPVMHRGVVVGLSNGAVQYWNGNTASASGGDSQGWTELQAPGSVDVTFTDSGPEVTVTGWANDTVNNLISLPNGQGIVVGLHSGAVYWFNNTIAADGTIIPGPSAGSGCSTDNAGACWKQLQSGEGSPTDVMIPYGQSGGFIVGYANGSVERWSGSGWTDLQNGNVWGSDVMTMIPYDGTTLVGAISGSPVIATNGVISAPSYVAGLAGSPALMAAEARCASGNYSSSGSGAGCSGYVLTVQETAGNPLRVGQTLYGGAGLASGTTIIQQISDGSGNLCSDSCNAGGTGVYLVSTNQLVAPGTPMSASDGTGFILGLESGEVLQYDNGFTQLVGTNWGSSVNAMIPWRDGFVVGLNNGATFYWSPSNNPGDAPNKLNYAGQLVTPYWQGNTGQGTPWAQLQGIGWDNAVTSMVQMGDGFALGLTAPDSSHNGAIEMFTGFGPASTASAFGYQQTASGPTALTPGNSFTQPATQSSLSSDASGSIQQLIAVNQLASDAVGNALTAQSLVAGLTNNGIYAWTGSNNNPDSTTTWTDIQTPGSASLSSTMLEAAWQYGVQANNTWGAAGGVGSVGDAGDPVFGLGANQAWCGTNCSSEGDYYAFVLDHPFGNDGVIYSIGDTLQGNLNLTALAYGYVFVPNGFLDKFKTDYYSAGLLIAAQGGPSLLLNPPDGLEVSDSFSLTGPSYSETEETEFGTFGVNVGIDASGQGSIGLSTAPLSTLTLAEALDTPGLLFTWNTQGNQDSLGFSFANFATTSLVTAAQIEQYFDPDQANATAEVTVTPTITLSYGLFTPASWPISLDLFKLSVGYSNPVSAALTVPLADIPSSPLVVTSEGILSLSAGILPGLTSKLSWSDQFTLYDDSDTLYPLRDV